MRLLFLLSLVLSAACIIAMPLNAAEIYKTVDENGNVIYTDQKPAENAKPIDLPELNVAEPHRALPKPPDAIDVESDRLDGFRITSPQAQENVWGTGGSVTVAMESSTELKPNMRVVVYLDGKAHDAGRALSITLDAVERGEHRLKAELRSVSGRVFARSEEIVFHMKQQANPSPTPRQRRPRGGN